MGFSRIGAKGRNDCILNNGDDNLMTKDLILTLGLCGRWAYDMKPLLLGFS